MPYDVSIQEKQSYIRVKVSGERSKGHVVQDSLHVWRKVGEVCRDKGIFRVVAIFDLNGELPIMAAYDIGKSAVKTDYFTGLKVAIVDLNEKSREINRFAETVATNRSFSGASKLFDDENQAVEWILG